jgi:hypothetical protein
MHSKLRFACFGLLLAASPLSAKWQPVERDGNLTKITNSDGSLILVTISDDVGKLDLNLTLKDASKILLNSLPCPDMIGQDPIRLPGKDAVAIMGYNGADKKICMLRLVRQQQKLALVIGTHNFSDAETTKQYFEVTDVAIQDAIQNWKPITQGSGNEPKKTQPQTAVQSPLIDGTQNSLKTAVARIPVANRPVGMGYLSEWDSVSMAMGYTPYLLFSGGFAVEADCAWNPFMSPRESARLNKCDTTIWRGTSANVYVGTDDPVASGGFTGFKAGERLSINMSNVSGGSAGSTSVLSSGTLRMDMQGNIQIGAWTGTNTQGGNFGAFSSNSGSASGQYHVEGYVLAIQLSDGTISFGSIARKQEGRDSYMFVNGEQYWN